jgi:uncharacterized damage-inducible protein DinB
MLNYARSTTLAAVANLGVAELDNLYDATSNSIGALLAHIAVVERGYQVLTFEERVPTAAETAAWEPALTLGAAARDALRGRQLEEYLQELTDVRERTLAALADRDDAWLESPVRAAPAMNAHWAWFHVMECEINHRGQIRWLRRRLETPE